MKLKEKIPVVVYARYSSNGQTEQSIEGQLSDCQDYADKNGYTIIGEYIDRALSGKESEHREQFQQMIKDSEKGRFKYVLVWKLDRFARNRYDSARYKAALKQNEVKVLSVKENISNSPEGIILESVLEGMAEYFLLDLIEKVHRGQVMSAKKCKALSKPPIGYKLDEDKHYIIDEETAPTIREVFRLWIENYPVVEIAELLNSKGIRTNRGNKWSVDAIRKIVENEKYHGVYDSMGIRVEGGIPAIVSDDVWMEAQARCERNKRGEFSRRARNHGGKVSYLLSGVLKCGCCGGNMSGETVIKHLKDGTTRKYPYYTCISKKLSPEKRPKIRCKKKSVACHKIDELVKRVLKDFMMSAEVLAEIKRLGEIISKEQGIDKNAVAVLKKQHRELDRKRKNILDAIEEGIWTPTTKERLQELEKQIANVAHELKAIQMPNQTFTDELIWLLTEFEPDESDEVEYWQDLIDLFIDSVVVDDDGTVTIIFKFFGPDGGKYRNHQAKFTYILENSSEWSDITRTT